MARILLAQDGIKPVKLDQYGRTLLMWASINGQEGVAGLLLARHNINPVKPDNNCKKRLWSAACRELEVVRLLLTLDDLNPDKPDNNAQIPLLAASIFRHERVVRLLLAWDDGNSDKPGNPTKSSVPGTGRRSQNPFSIRAPKLHLRAIQGKSLSSAPSLILLAVIQYLLRLPLSTPKFKGSVVYHVQRYHLSVL